MTNREAISAALAMLAGVFRQALTPEAVEGYRIALEDCSEAELGRATKRAVKECRFMPTPAELLDFAGKAGHRSLAADVAEAWGAVRMAMDKHDYTTSVDFGPLVNAVIHNLGGWRQLCDTSIPDLEWRRKKFEEVYAAYRNKLPGELPRGGGHCRGEFGGVPVRIQIGPVPTQPVLPEIAYEINPIVRDLANAKSIDDRERDQ